MRELYIFLLIAALGITYLFQFGPPALDGSRPAPGNATARKLGLALANSSASFYQEPVLDQNFPDPAVIEVDGVFYSYATNSNQSNIAVARSHDLVYWTVLPDALPALAPWVRPQRNLVWAPEVIKVGDAFLMYYVANDQASRRQCIGVAISANPSGPFVDSAAAPFLCPPGFDLAIDPNPYADAGQLYLYFNGTCCGGPNGIYAQELSQDGLATMGTPKLMLRVDSSWEGNVTEAPTMVKHAGKHYLFYSGNDYRNETYAVGYAACKSVLGPCTKAEENPLLATGSTASRAIGPGHQSIVRVGQDYWILYHGWHGAVGYRSGGRRVLWLQPLTWDQGKPMVGIPARGGG